MSFINVLRLRRKSQPFFTYTQEEIAVQIGQIADLTQQREQAVQHAMSRRGPNGPEVDEFDAAIATSQKVLNFMLDKNLERQS